MALTQVQGGMLAGSSNTVTTIQSNGTTAITVDASQNVGIGTTSPDGKLKVVASGANLIVGFSGTQNYFDASENIFRNFAGTERMRIDSSGNLLVNAPASPTTKVVIQTPVGSSAAALSLYTGLGSGVYADVQYFYTANKTSLVGFITYNGTTMVYGAVSDYRLKENIAPMTSALTKIAQLKPVTYKWKLNGSDGQGFVAHELAEVFPDAVVGEKDATYTYTDEDGNEQTSIKPQGIDTSFLVATLTAAIQELNAKVDAQALEIAALKATK
jgi:hypothetical protein